MEQGRLAACHAFGVPTQSSPELFPYGIYTIPEISTVGRSEEELTEQGVPYEVGKAQYREIARGQIIGYITLDSGAPNAFNENDAVLAQTFAHQAAAAIDNARLFTSLEQTNEELSKAYDTTLEGWAIVDNTVGEDWNDVELSLVAGAPQSFMQQQCLLVDNNRERRI